MSSWTIPIISYPCLIFHPPNAITFTQRYLTRDFLESTFDWIKNTPFYLNHSIVIYVQIERDIIYLTWLVSCSIGISIEDTSVLMVIRWSQLIIIKNKFARTWVKCTAFSFHIWRMRHKRKCVANYTHRSKVNYRLAYAFIRLRTKQSLRKSSYGCVEKSGKHRHFVANYACTQ